MKTIAQQEKYIAWLNEDVAKRDQALSEKENHIATLTMAAVQQKELIDKLAGDNSKGNDEIVHLNQLLAERNERISLIQSSRSWAMTRPYRLLGDSIRSVSSSIVKGARKLSETGNKFIIRILIKVTQSLPLKVRNRL